MSMAGLNESLRHTSENTKGCLAYQPSKLNADQDDAGESSEPRSKEAGSFDCNICLELAQDPVVTMCGHLFCWPCIYRWLHSSLANNDCPVCKANVEEEKVIPLYGRGKIGSVDPRTKAVPGVNIPHRPPGHWQAPPETARRPEQQYQPFGFGFTGGNAANSAAIARFGNVTLSAGFGLFPALFGFQVHEYSGHSAFGSPYAFTSAVPAASQGNPFPSAPSRSNEQQQEALLSRLLLFLGFVVMVFFVLF